MKETKYWIKFHTPGAFFSESFTKDCEKDIDPVSVEWPKSAFAFTLHSRTDVIDGQIYKGKVNDLSGFYWHPDSTIESLESVKRNPKATKTLIRNMEGNKWPHIVWNRWGHSPQPFDSKKDTVLL